MHQHGFLELRGAQLESKKGGSGSACLFTSQLREFNLPLSFLRSG